MRIIIFEIKYSFVPIQFSELEIKRQENLKPNRLFQSLFIQIKI